MGSPKRLAFFDGLPLAIVGGMRISWMLVSVGIVVGCTSPVDSDQDLDSNSEAALSPDTAPVADPPVGSGCAATITLPPKFYGLDPFYTQYLDATGIPVVSSGRVEARALRRACAIAVVMMSGSNATRLEMIRNHTGLVVMANEEVITNIPEFADLYEAFPGTDWDRRVRGLGGVLDRPMGVASEENLLCATGDPYYGLESVMVHEFAHTMYNLGIATRDAAFDRSARFAYSNALTWGRWSGTFAETTFDEYWAEGVQTWFGTNSPPDALHNDIDTRAELAEYDPELYYLIGEVYPKTNAVRTCP